MASVAATRAPPVQKLRQQNDRNSEMNAYLLHYLRPDRGTYCLGGIPVVSPEVARRGLACRSAAVIIAGCGLAWPCACGRWLPVWLPAISLAVLMFECLYPEAEPRESSRRSIRLSQTRCAAARPMRRLVKARDVLRLPRASR